LSQNDIFSLFTDGTIEADGTIENVYDSGVKQFR